MKANDGPEAFAELERGVHAALETYANVHRGSGHNSLVSTHLYEQAREIVLEHLGLNKEQVRGHLLLTPKGRGAQGATQAGKLSKPVKPGHRSAAGCQGVGRQSQGAAQRRAFPDRRRDGQACLPRLGHLGQGAGQIRGRHARDRQRHRVCHGAAADPAVSERTLSGMRRRRADERRKADGAEILYHDELEKYSGRELLDELRQTLIGRGVRVPTAEGARPFVNLDNAASTPTFDADLERCLPDMAPAWARTARDHSGGQVHLRRGAGRASGRL